MTDPSAFSQPANRVREKRRFPRHPSSLRGEVKTPRDGVWKATLENIGRGGLRFETRAVLSVGDRVSLRIDPAEVDPPGEIVLHGKTVWRGQEGARSWAYGVALSECQAALYERLRRSREVAEAKGVAKALGLPFLDLTPSMVERRALSYVARDFALSVHGIPVKLRDERLMVAMADPSDAVALNKLRLFSRCQIIPVVATRSAILESVAQSFGVSYLPSGRDGSEGLCFGRPRPGRRPRIVALTSSSIDIQGKWLAANLAALLNREEKRALVVDFDPGSPALSAGISGITAEYCEWMILALAMDSSPLSVDWAIRADETLVMISPSHWEKGYSYAEALFRRFVEVHSVDRTAHRTPTLRQRVLNVSVLCAPVSDLQEGFKTFRRIEAKVHQELAMKEPGFDIRLHYMGAILEDRKNIRKAEKAGIPLSVLKPHSPASRCIAHIAQSLLRPPHARDPRIRLTRFLASRIFG